MRLLRTGLDGSGRSCVTEIVTSEAPAEGLGSEVLFSTRREAPLGPDPDTPTLELDVQPGEVVWSIVHYPPGGEYGFHQTDTIDLDTVLHGSIELRLDDGAHQMGPGDAVVMNGVRHAWRAGAEGCTFTVVFLGRARP